MYGIGILKGLGVTLKHFLLSYVDDVRWLGRRYRNPKALTVRQSPRGEGIFTVQYPEERLPVPEEFRFVPFLVYDEGEQGERLIRCTSCGICAKVCPPQCIWIERAVDPATGRPVPAPREFAIDVDLCMNCGLCAEFVPVRCHQDGPRLRAGHLRSSRGEHLWPRAAAEARPLLRLHPPDELRAGRGRSGREAGGAGGEQGGGHGLVPPAPGAFPVYQHDTEMLFPMRVAPALWGLRGAVWRRLVERAVAAPEGSLDQLAFCLMMIRLASCLTCHTDSFRAMRGCTQCATQVVRRFRGSDADLVSLFERARAEIALHLQADDPGQPDACSPGLEVIHET